MWSDKRDAGMGGGMEIQVRKQNKNTAETTHLIPEPFPLRPGQSP